MNGVIVELKLECCESDVFGHRRKKWLGQPELEVGSTHNKDGTDNTRLSIYIIIASTRLQIRD